MFKLFQIFGFREESMTSIFDKIDMKLKFNEAYYSKQRKYQELFLE